MTPEEIESLIRFGKELNQRITNLRLSQAELSRRTGSGADEPISQGYISDILRVGRGDSQKYFRLQRDKVVRLAEAVNWPTSQALSVAGFASSGRSDRSESANLPAEIGEMAHLFTALSPDKRRVILIVARSLADESRTDESPELEPVDDADYIADSAADTLKPLR